jgi:hypothetical protein
MGWQVALSSSEQPTVVPFTFPQCSEVGTLARDAVGGEEEGREGEEGEEGRGWSQWARKRWDEEDDGDDHV